MNTKTMAAALGLMVSALAAGCAAGSERAEQSSENAIVEVQRHSFRADFTRSSFVGGAWTSESVGAGEVTVRFLERPELLGAQELGDVEVRVVHPAFDGSGTTVSQFANAKAFRSPNLLSGGGPATMGFRICEGEPGLDDAVRCPSQEPGGGTVSIEFTVAPDPFFTKEPATPGKITGMTVRLFDPANAATSTQLSAQN